MKENNINELSLELSNIITNNNLHKLNCFIEKIEKLCPPPESDILIFKLFYRNKMDQIHEGESILEKAIETKSQLALKMLECFLKYNLPNYYFYQKIRPLEQLLDYALCFGNIECIQYLLSHRASPMAHIPLSRRDEFRKEGKFRMPSLVPAVYTGDIEIVTTIFNKVKRGSYLHIHSRYSDEDFHWVIDPVATALKYEYYAIASFMLQSLDAYGTSAFNTKEELLDKKLTRILESDSSSDELIKQTLTDIDEFILIRNRDTYGKVRNICLINSIDIAFKNNTQWIIDEILQRLTPEDLYPIKSALKANNITTALKLIQQHNFEYDIYSCLDILQQCNLEIAKNIFTNALRFRRILWGFEENNFMGSFIKELVDHIIENEKFELLHLLVIYDSFAVDWDEIPKSELIARLEANNQLAKVQEIEEQNLYDRAITLFSLQICQGNVFNLLPNELIILILQQQNGLVYDSNEKIAEFIEPRKRIDFS